MRKLLAALLSISTLAASLPAGAAPLEKRPYPDLKQAYPNETYSQYYYRRYYYRRPPPAYYYHRHHDNGAAVAAGVAGLAAGALIAGAIANQAQAQPTPPAPPGTVSPSVAAYCARKYRSYDPATGTFLAHNGMRYVCTYP